MNKPAGFFRPPINNQIIWFEDQRQNDVRIEVTGHYIELETSIFNNSILLTQANALELATLLTRFAETGKIVDE